MSWPNTSFLNQCGIALPIIQAPMAGSCNWKLVIEVCNAGGLGSLPCAMMTAEEIEQQISHIRQHTDKPFNLNFFCHDDPDADNVDASTWRGQLKPYYDELSIDIPSAPLQSLRQPFNNTMCEVVERLGPNIVSFHFGLPPGDLFDRVKATGCQIWCSATTVEEALWLENNAVDVIIAQGAEAGGHRGIFLNNDITTQSGTMALLPQIVDAVSVPVVAAGGIADGRGMAAAFCLGASAAQIGTAYLLCPEATTSDIHKKSLENATEGETALTNLFSGRPARGIYNRIMREKGPMNSAVPIFPLAGGDLAPLKSAMENKGSPDFSSLWSGQSIGIKIKPAGTSAAEVTSTIVRQAEKILGI